MTLDEYKKQVASFLADRYMNENRAQEIIKKYDGVWQIFMDDGYTPKQAYETALAVTRGQL